MFIRNPTSETKKLTSNIAIGRAERPENPPETITHTVSMQKRSDATHETQRQEKFATSLEKSNQNFDAQTENLRLRITNM